MSIALGVKLDQIAGRLAVAEKQLASLNDALARLEKEIQLVIRTGPTRGPLAAHNKPPGLTKLTQE